MIFDFGGVITASPFDAFHRLEAEHGLPHDFIRRVNSINAQDNAWARFERAEIDAAGFDQAFAAEARGLGHELAGSAVIAVLAGAVRPAMVAALDLLKAKGFAIGCITNNVPSGNGAGMARSKSAAAEIASILARFDHVIESSKVGVRKPDPAIYRMMCDALNMHPQQCIYLDDLGINCKPAAMLGMRAIKVTSGQQALMDLGMMLNLEFS